MLVKRAWIPLGICLVVLSSVVSEVRGEEEPEPEPVDWTAKAKEAWSHTCQKCHTAPDPAFETDRGFLTQIMETT